MVKTMASATINGEGGRGHVKINLSVMREPLDEHAFVQPHGNVRLSQHTFEQYDANLGCLCFQPETMYAFCAVIERCKKKPPGPRPCEAVLPQIGDSARPTTTNHTGVPER